MQPGALQLAFAKYGLIALTILAMTPRFIVARFELLFGFIVVFGGIAFYGSFFAHRAMRLRNQLRTNKLAQDSPPIHFALYLRSFRQANRIKVRNYSETRAERILHGRFWDIELALSQCLVDKLPVVALGSTSHSLGAAKLSSDESSWKQRFSELAALAKVVIIVPDQRPSTLWELEQVVSDQNLRTKTVIVMPPKQRGWRRMFSRAPSIELAWEGARHSMSGRIELPVYDARGAFLLFSAAEQSFIALPFHDFQPEAVRAAVSSAATGATDPRAGAGQAVREVPDERWWTLMDPAALGLTLFAVIAIELLAGESVFSIGSLQAVAGIALSGSAITLLWTLRAYTLRPERTTPPSRIARLLPSTTKVLRGLPYMARATINIIVFIPLVFAFRSFAFEPFKIPSGSMIPTLLVGDLIVVNKFHYGIRLPIVNKKILDNNPVQRGDLMVFRFPVDPRQDFIKRVVGIPGDEVTYFNQKLSINGQPVPVRPMGDFYDEDSLRYAPQFSEKLGAVEHGVLVDPRRQAYYGPDPKTFPMSENCRYSPEGVVCRVPSGHYFMMGDNRDNSNDSRYWGFVPDENIVGRPIFVWMNLGNSARIGSIR
jgi:signal peptidase I